jgi:hypothetical protein
LGQIYHRGKQITDLFERVKINALYILPEHHDGFTVNLARSLSCHFLEGIANIVDKPGHWLSRQRH